MAGSDESPEYQLVLEFAGDGSDIFQRVVELESLLDEQLNSGEVDGNDLGQGVANIFIITDHPDICFAEAMSYVQTSPLKPAAAGYRSLDEEDYVRLWPQGDKTPFELK